VAWARLTFCGMLEALAVQTKGLGLSLCCSMQSPISRSMGPTHARQAVSVRAESKCCGAAVQALCDEVRPSLTGLRCRLQDREAK
jgi:hypothetical protein